MENYNSQNVLKIVSDSLKETKRRVLSAIHGKITNHLQKNEISEHELYTNILKKIERSQINYKDYRERTLYFLINHRKHAYDWTIRTYKWQNYFLMFIIFILVWQGNLSDLVLSSYIATVVLQTIVIYRSMVQSVFSTALETEMNRYIEQTKYQNTIYPIRTDIKDTLIDVKKSSCPTKKNFSIL